MSHDHDHGPGPGHDHGHSHAHGQAPGPGADARYAIGVGVNAAFVVAEVICGLTAHSVALVADAAHNLTDVLGLLLAWGATVLARRLPSATHTYGLRKTTLLATLANAILLLVAVGAVVWEALQRLRHPAAVNATIVVVVAGCGVLINGASALLFLRGRDHDTNLRAAFAHLAADALIALGVVASGVIVMRSGWLWVDPVTSLGVSALVVTMTWSLLREAFGSVIDAVPGHIDYAAVRDYLRQLPNVAEVHDLHIWPLSSVETALTAHLVLPPGGYGPSFVHDACKELHDRFRIEHATLQVESTNVVDPCVLSPDDCV
jgi:cobalt-zinc-cadmium efflux system protein